jgi:hypothetical protein
MLIRVLCGQNTESLICIHLCIVLLMHVAGLPGRVVVLGHRETVRVLGLATAKVDWKLVVHIVGSYRAVHLFYHDFTILICI